MIMDKEKSKNPYNQGTDAHNTFNTSFMHFLNHSDERLVEELAANRKRANEYSIYSESEMDNFEIDCRAIEIILSLKESK